MLLPGFFPIDEEAGKGRNLGIGTVQILPVAIPGRRLRPVAGRHIRVKRSAMSRGLLHDLDAAYLPDAADVDAAGRLLAAVTAHSPTPEAAAAWADLCTSDPGRRLISAIGGNSPFLATLMLREPDFVAEMIRDGIDAALAARLVTLDTDLGQETDAAKVSSRLRRAKRQVALAVAIADIAGLWPLDRVTGALSAFAEQAVALAVRHLLRKAANAGTLTLADTERPELGSGLIVLAMGKLGARELNYSSDIDLVLFYDQDRIVMRDPDRMQTVFVRLARDLVAIMEERTADGYVFRTDLRLRPDPAATPLALSVEAAETYYTTLGQNWERAAMIKARPIAGDIEAGERFTAFLAPWIWRRHLDFAAIRDIHSIKRQIDAHRGHGKVAVDGHNVKLGRGGIREIEFFAQTQQLIFGGRDARVRAVRTEEALAALTDTGRLDPAVKSVLVDAYRYLRRVEHRLQMIDDRQTHDLPTDPGRLTAFAVFLGHATLDDFRAEMRGVLERVEAAYASLFEQAPPLTGPGNLVFTGADDDPGTLQSLKDMGYANPTVVTATVRGWHHGRTRATRTQRARQLLTELVPRILGAFAERPDPEQAFLRFDAFLSNLPAGVQIFSMLFQKPEVLDQVADILGVAPSLGDYLSRNPAVLETLLAPDFFSDLPDRESLAADLDRTLANARDYEDVLDLVRRWAKDKRFQAGVHVLRGLIDGEAAGPFLADIAELCLAALLPSATDELARRHGRFRGGGMAILALGKLGARQMSVGSDLDLITIYSTDDDGHADGESDGERPLAATQYHIRLTQRLVAALTALTGEGRLYEVDLRLRPSGAKGPLAISLEGFEAYHADSAWTWERMALTRARVVAGPENLTRRIEGVIAAALIRRRDPKQLLDDVASMRARMDREYGTEDPWDVKYARGGLVDIDFVTQYLILRHAAEQPGVIAADTAIALDRLADHGLIARQDAGTLKSMLSLARRVQSFLRLAFEGPLDPDRMTPLTARRLVRVVIPDAATDVDFARAQATLVAAERAAFDVYQRLIGEPARQQAETDREDV